MSERARKMLFKSVLLVAAVVAVAAQEEDNATGTDPFAAGFAAGYAAAQGSGEDEVGEGRLLAKTVAPPRAKKPKNNDVCYTVAATWWSTREAEKTRALVNNMDTDCQAWDQQPEFCNKKSARVGLTGYTQAQMDATCSTVGAHDHRCLGNPCNSLNTGDCSLQVSRSWCGRCLLSHCLLTLASRAPRPPALPPPLRTRRASVCGGGARTSPITTPTLSRKGSARSRRMAGTSFPVERAVADQPSDR